MEKELKIKENEKRIKKLEEEIKEIKDVGINHFHNNYGSLAKDFHALVRILHRGYETTINIRKRFILPETLLKKRKENW